MSAKNNPTIANKRAQLTELLAWFESEDFAVEEAMAKFEEAEKLANEIETELLEYKNNIILLKQRFDQAE